jgi:hypothetical protein
MWRVRITIVAIKIQRCVKHCWATYHCQQYRNTEWCTQILLWWIPVPGNNTTHLGHQVKVSDFLSDFNQMWDVSKDFHNVSGKSVQGKPPWYWRTEGQTEKQKNMTTLTDVFLYQGNSLSGDYMSPSVRLWPSISDLNFCRNSMKFGKGFLDRKLLITWKLHENRRSESHA